MNIPIIPRSPHRKNEKIENYTVIRNIATLCELLPLPESIKDEANETIEKEGSFPLRVGRSFLNQIEPDNPDDPLLLQILPRLSENRQVEGFNRDPVGDLEHSVSNGVIHKYRNRVLLTVTGACAIHCRYCFRRNFPYSSENPQRDNWDGALSYIEQHREVEEVILSGGDPLMLELDKLKALVQKIEEIGHIKRLRIHTRIPVVAPEMVNKDVVTWLGGISLPVIMVIHCNHSNELSTEVVTTLSHLTRAGVRLFNQSVLLKGINDNPHTLAELSKKLFYAGVQPYYLNLLDRAHGTAHFEVSDELAREISATLHTLLPGYLIPKVVRDKGKSTGKVVFGIECL